MSRHAFLLGNAQTLINRYLALDPEIAARFGELEGKCLLFDISNPAMQIYCLPLRGELQLSAEAVLPPDCTLQGSAMALLRLTREDNPTAAISRGEVIISGDSRLAQRFSDILGAVDIDWEELLSKFTGDFIAHRVGRSAQQLFSWLRDSRDALQLNTSEYLQEEAMVLPCRIEIDSFMDQVDTLRSDVDRAEARLRRLEKRPTVPGS